MRLVSAIRAEAGDVERLALPADFQPAPLAHRVVNHSAMAAEHLAAFGMDDLPRRLGRGMDRADDFGIVAIGHEADVLAVRLGGHAQARRPGQPARLGLGQAAQREAQEIELRLGGREQEIALVAPRVFGPV